MLLQELQGKNIAVWGLGKEGLANLQLLVKKVAFKHLYVYTDEPCLPLSAYPQVQYFSGEEFSQMLLHTDIIIKSPGVSIYKDKVIQAQKFGIKFTTSSDLFLSEMRSHFPQTTVIGITGTKGKSTTSCLMYNALKALGQDVVLCGNIGRPLVELMGEQHRFVVCELSSYQCSDLSVSPHVVLFTNLFPEHIDWHLSHDKYYQDKVHLVAHQTLQDICFVNYNCAKLKHYCSAYEKNFTFYNQEEGFANINNQLCYQGRPLLTISETLMQGFHNLDNMAGVLSVIKHLGFDIKSVLESFKTFQPLAHRLQKVGIKDHILFINDSISTVPETAMAAIKSFDKSMGIFLGGYDRQQDYHALAEFLDKTPKVKVICTLFQTGPRIAQTLREVLTRKDIILIEETDFATAVNKVFTAVKNIGAEMILFSPAAPSYDAYKSFEVRGEEFMRFYSLL